MAAKKPPLPSFKTDEEAEEFVANSDLTQYDLSGGVRVRYAFTDRDATLSAQVPQPLLVAVKEAADDDGVPLEQLVRRYIKDGLSRRDAAKRRKAG